MRTLGIHHNIPVSNINLTPSLGFNFISHPLVMDKFIRVNSRAIISPPKLSHRVLHYVKCTPAVTIKSRLIMVTHTDHLSQNKTLNQQWQMTPDPSPRQPTNCITDCSQINLVFQSTLLLTHKLELAYAIEMGAEWSKLPTGSTTATHTGLEHQSSRGQEFIHTN